MSRVRWCSRVDAVPLRYPASPQNACDRRREGSGQASGHQRPLVPWQEGPDGIGGWRRRRRGREPGDHRDFSEGPCSQRPSGGFQERPHCVLALAVPRCVPHLAARLPLHVGLLVGLENRWHFTARVPGGGSGKDLWRASGPEQGLRCAPSERVTGSQSPRGRDKPEALAGGPQRQGCP